ncbi:MAG TPA: hypothetical protein VHE99_07370 [Gammaproteobacteria bacterium]|nr:hypothetical protein [Gammaproteobacteria bacterium]
MSNKDLFEQVNLLNKITANVIKRANECSIENLNDIIDVSSKHIKNLGTTKGSEGLFDIANEMSATYANCSQRTLNVALENFADFTKWLENSAKNINPIVAAAVKPFADKMVKEKE